MSKSLTVLGSSNSDFVLQLPRLPEPGETIRGGQFFQTFGGKGANQAVAAARAGHPTRFLTGLGPDAVAEQMLDSFRREGIDVQHVFRTSEPTGTALILVDASGENVIGIAPGANDSLTPDWVAAHEEVIADSAALVLQLELPPAVTAAAIQIARRVHVSTQLNFAPADDAAREFAPLVDVLIVNETEAAQLAGSSVHDLESARSTLRVLQNSGPACVILTMGADGVLAADANGDAIHVPAPAVEVVDTTAAGDTFCGAFAVARAEGLPLEPAIRWATRAASLSVTRLGAQASIPHRTEIDAA
ncbi:MAG: ribokinase [Chthoniobacterales bacterium]